MKILNDIIIKAQQISFSKLWFEWCAIVVMITLIVALLVASSLTLGSSTGHRIWKFYLKDKGDLKNEDN